MRKQTRWLQFRQDASIFLLVLAVGVVFGILAAPFVAPMEWLTSANVGCAFLACVALVVAARAVRPFSRRELAG